MKSRWHKIVCAVVRARGGAVRIEELNLEARLLVDGRWPYVEPSAADREELFEAALEAYLRNGFGRMSLGFAEDVVTAFYGRKS